MDSYPAAMSIIIVIDFANGRANPSTSPTVHPSIPGIRDEETKTRTPINMCTAAATQSTLWSYLNLSVVLLCLIGHPTPRPSPLIWMSAGAILICQESPTRDQYPMSTCQKVAARDLLLLLTLSSALRITQGIDNRWGVSTQTDQSTTMFLLCYSIINYHQPGHCEWVSVIASSSPTRPTPTSALNTMACEGELSVGHKLFTKNYHLQWNFNYKFRFNYFIRN